MLARTENKEKQVAMNINNINEEKKNTYALIYLLIYSLIYSLSRFLLNKRLGVSPGGE